MHLRSDKDPALDTPRQLRSVIVLLLALGVVAACSSNAGNVQSCRAVEILMRESGPSPGFGDVSGLDADRSGNIYVVDGMANQLLSFDPQGKLRWAAGRAGAGPGELRNPQDVRVVEGVVAVRDLGNSRASLWDTAGNHRGTIDLARLPIAGVPAWFGLLDDRTLASITSPNYFTSEQPTNLVPTGWLLRVEVGSHKVDTVSALRFPRTQFIQTGRGRFPLLLPFEAVSVVGITERGTLIVADGVDYSLSAFDIHGQNISRFQGFGPRPPVRDEERQSFVARLPDPSLESRIEFPAHLPAVRSVTSVVGDPEAFFVRTYWAADERTRWDGWSVNGEYQYSLALPSSTRFLTVLGDSIAYTVDIRTEDGVSQVAISRILDRAAACPGFD